MLEVAPTAVLIFRVGALPCISINALYWIDTPKIVQYVLG